MVPTGPLVTVSTASVRSAGERPVDATPVFSAARCADDLAVQASQDSRSEDALHSFAAEVVDHRRTERRDVWNCEPRFLDEDVEQQSLSGLQHNVVEAGVVPARHITRHVAHRGQPRVSDAAAHGVSDVGHDADCISWRLDRASRIAIARLVGARKVFAAYGLWRHARGELRAGRIVAVGEEVEVVVDAVVADFGLRT